MLGRGEGYKVNGFGISANHHWKGGGYHRKNESNLS